MVHHIQMCIQAEYRGASPAGKSTKPRLIV